MSIAEKLSAAGYDLDEIKAAKRSYYQRAVEIVAVETSEGDVFGLSYACDFRAEEEWGVGDLSRAFASRASKKATSHRILAADLKAGTAEESGPRGGGLGAPGNQMDLVTVLDDVVSLRTVEISGSLEDTWSTAKDEARQIESARGSIRDSRGYITGVPEAWRLERELFRDLRERARAAGIEKPGRSKAAVIQQIIDAAVPEHPYTEPADFHDGRHLVIPRRGAVGVVLGGTRGGGTGRVPARRRIARQSVRLRLPAPGRARHPARGPGRGRGDRRLAPRADGPREEGREAPPLRRHLGVLHRPSEAV